MKKIWNWINEGMYKFLAWFNDEAVAFWFAAVLAILAFLCADPIEGIFSGQVALFAFLVGILTVGVLLFGTSIVSKRDYPVRSFLYGAIGALAGALVSWIIFLIAA